MKHWLKLLFRILAHSKSGLELHAFPIFCSLCIYDTVVSELKTNWKFRYLKIACFITVKQNRPIFRSRDDIFMSGFGHVSFFAIRCENWNLQGATHLGTRKLLHFLRTQPLLALLEFFPGFLYIVRWGESDEKSLLRPFYGRLDWAALGRCVVFCFRSQQVPMLFQKGWEFYGDLDDFLAEKWVIAISA